MDILNNKNYTICLAGPYLIHSYAYLILLINYLQFKFLN